MCWVKNELTNGYREQQHWEESRRAADKRPVAKRLVRTCDKIVWTVAHPEVLPFLGLLNLLVSTGPNQISIKPPSFKMESEKIYISTKTKDSNYLFSKYQIKFL